MSARDRLRQVFYRCVSDARHEPDPFIAQVSACNAAILAEVILHCTDDECATRVDKLLKSAPELFAS